MSDRNYTDDALATFVDDLDDGELIGLTVAGMLPADPFMDLEPRLTNHDVAYMIRLADRNK